MDFLRMMGRDGMPARLASDQVRAQTVSGAWLGAVRTALNSPSPRLFHLVTRIEQPIAEDAAVRQAADGLLADLKLPPIETVANTIFPSELAATSKNWEHLSQRYRKAYPTLKRWRANRPGTYFGRLVAYPAAGQEIDQVVSAVIPQLDYCMEPAAWARLPPFQKRVVRSLFELSQRQVWVRS